MMWQMGTSQSLGGSMSKSEGPKETMKYILVTGGVISGIGKGVIASSIGTLMKACNMKVTAIKIDPYINIDAGTFSPYEHGEVFVLDDGGEVDLDLGNYERFLDIRLHRENNITTGKIYKDVIERERKGEYLGKTVQVVPHISNAIQDTVQSVAKLSVEKDEDGKDVAPEICIIELGGTIGDIESRPFVEAFRQFQFRVGQENFCSVHVSLVPQVAGEQKTKPTQNSVKDLRGEGLAPDVIVCRSQNPITPEVKQKISYFCHVDPNQVICTHDVPSIYQVPGSLMEQGLVEYFRRRLNMSIPAPCLSPSPSAGGKNLLNKWRRLAEKYDNVNKEVTIALVGKYTKLEDAYASVVKSLKHSCLHLNHRLKLLLIESGDLEEETKRQNPLKYHEAWKQLHQAQGILVPGGFGERGINGKIAAIEKARTSNIPFLGVCLGFQCAVIEYCRNVIGWTDANSAEIDKNTSHKVIIDMPEHTTGDKGGTMRLGKRKTIFHHKDSTIYKLYGSKDEIEERHRHRYEVNPDYVDQLEAAGLRIVARDETSKRMEIIDIKSHPYFVGVQFHPEYLSRPLNPSPPYLGLILAAIGKLVTFVRNDCRRISPMNLDTESSDDEVKGIDIESMYLTLPSAAAGK